MTNNHSCTWFGWLHQQQMLYNRFPGKQIPKSRNSAVGFISAGQLRRSVFSSGQQDYEFISLRNVYIFIEKMDKSLAPMY
jgi:hypothetical protein